MEFFHAHDADYSGNTKGPQLNTITDRADLFIKYYDTLFATKDYPAEIDYMQKAWEKYGQGNLRSILDVGCGTGNHSIEFARCGYDVTGIDISDDMLLEAKKKLEHRNYLHLSFIKHDIRSSLLDSQRDLGYSMFNVVHYIEGVDELLFFFSGIYANIRAGGIYIFDCWNGDAVAVNPPAGKQIDSIHDGVSISGYVTPDYSKAVNASDYYYRFTVNDHGETSEFEHIMRQTYWCPGVLVATLANAGFSQVHIFRHLTFDEHFSNEDYKLSYVAIV